MSLSVRFQFRVMTQRIKMLGSGTHDGGEEVRRVPSTHREAPSSHDEALQNPKCPVFPRKGKEAKVGALPPPSRSPLRSSSKASDTRTQRHRCSEGPRQKETGRRKGCSCRLPPPSPGRRPPRSPPARALPPARAS